MSARIARCSQCYKICHRCRQSSLARFMRGCSLNCQLILLALAVALSVSWIFVVITRYHILNLGLVFVDDVETGFPECGSDNDPSPGRLFSVNMTSQFGTVVNARQQAPIEDIDEHPWDPDVQRLPGGGTPILSILSDVEHYHLDQMKCAGVDMGSLQQLQKMRNHTAAMLPGCRPRYLDNFKSPCWELDTKKLLSSWPEKTYRLKHITHWGYNFNSNSSSNKNWGDSTTIHNKTANNNRLVCTPYAYLVGMPKCGTTDLYDKLTWHPNVTGFIAKEPEYWARRMLGDWTLIRKFANLPLPFWQYAEAYDAATRQITSSKQGGYHGMIAIDASPSTLWEIARWPLLPGNEHSKEPQNLPLNFIRLVNPNARIMVILRDPVERLFSHYVHRCTVVGFSTSVKDFARQVQKAVELFRVCLRTRSLKECVFDTCLNHLVTGMPRVTLRAGIYLPFIRELFDVFPRSQIKLVTLEEYGANETSVLSDLADFLGLGPWPEERLQRIMSSTSKNARRFKQKMTNDTRHILQEFYGPYNNMLVDYLNDTRFAWPYR